MKIILFFIFTVIPLGLTKRNRPVLPARIPAARIPATTLDTSDKACPSNSLIDEEVRKTKTMLRTETWFRPCDCGGPGWKKIAFYNFSQQECPRGFTRDNNVSCQTAHRYYECRGYNYHTSLSLPLPVKGLSYSSVCGQVRGRGSGGAFYNALTCKYNLEQHYVHGVSLTHGPAGRRRHIWTFAAADADGYPLRQWSCSCSNINRNWPFTTPDGVGNDYFCDSDRLYTTEEGYNGYGAWYHLWDGKGCGPISSCCEWNNPPYFCKHLHNTTSEDMEIRLFSSYYKTPTVSLIEIFVK